MDAKKRVLAIGAHPDDIELGCAGSFLRLKDTHELGVAICSPGSFVQVPDERLLEQERACWLMGVPKEHVFQGSFLDAAIPCDRSLVQFLEMVLHKFRPDYVITHYPKDTHQDHLNVSQATLAAARRACNILYYETLSTFDFHPQMFVDIGDVGGKMQVIGTHESQNSRIDVAGRSLEEYARDVAAYRGIQSRFYKYAEGFVPMRIGTSLQ